MGWPSREEVIRQMGLDTSQSMEAPDLHYLLSCLEDQKEIGIDQPEVPGRACLYGIAARSMYRYSFHTSSEPYYDTKRKALWYLGRKVPKKNEFPDLDIRARYNILRKGRWLFVYANPNHERPKRLLQYDMQDPGHRRSFVDVRRWTEMRAQKYKSDLQAPPKHKDLLRIKRAERTFDPQVWFGCIATGALIALLLEDFEEQKWIHINAPDLPPGPQFFYWAASKYTFQVVFGYTGPCYEHNCQLLWALGRKACILIPKLAILQLIRPSHSFQEKTNSRRNPLALNPRCRRARTNTQIPHTRSSPQTDFHEYQVLGRKGDTSFLITSEAQRFITGQINTQWWIGETNCRKFNNSQKGGCKVCALFVTLCVGDNKLALEVKIEIELA